MSVEFHVTGRAGGKTTAMLDWMRAAPAGDHRVIVCHSNHDAMELLRLARDRELDLESWQFVGLEEVQSFKQRPGWDGVLYGRGGRIVLGVDNLDLMLPRLFGWPVARITATGRLVSRPEPSGSPTLREALEMIRRRALADLAEGRGSRKAFAQDVRNVAVRALRASADPLADTEAAL